MKKKNDIKILKGEIVYSKNIEGKAIIIKKDEDISKLIKTRIKNRILVIHSLEPKISIFLPKVKGIICDKGGMFSHAATVARELFIPCIVNTKKATRLIKNDDYVIIDRNGNIWLRRKK